MQSERIRAHLHDRYWLIVDHDNAPTVQAHTLYGIEPNIVIYNQTNHHRHQAFWLLADPVHCQPEARERHPYRYLTAIESAYDAQYGCDPCFARHIHRNPTAFINDVDWRHWRGHTLAELAEPVDLSPRRAKQQHLELSEGRNSALFHALRHWAYPQVGSARSGSYDAWHRQVMTRSIAMSHEQDHPTGALPAREVGYVAKSVAEFVYYRYTGAGGAMDAAGREEQARRGRLGGKVSKRPTRSGKSKADLLPEVIRLKGMGYSNRDIAEDLGIGSASVSRYLQP
jgi:hypothetical protein